MGVEYFYDNDSRVMVCVDAKTRHAAALVGHLPILGKGNIEWTAGDAVVVPEIVESMVQISEMEMEILMKTLNIDEEVLQGFERDCREIKAFNEYS